MDYILELLEGQNDNLNIKYLIEDHFKLHIETISNKIEINILPTSLYKILLKYMIYIAHLNIY